MKQNNVIPFHPQRQPEPFDFAAYNRRAEARYRASEIRAWIAQIVDSAVTLAIGGCLIFCVYLAMTML